LARASNVYVVQRVSDGAVLAGWTVKYQMEEWLRCRDMSRDAMERTLKVVRCKDGGGLEHTTVVPWEEIL